MTTRISRNLIALTLAFGVLAAVSAPSHAALSTADRSQAAPVAAPAEAQATLAVAAAPATTATDGASSPVVKAAPVTAAAPTTPVAAPRKAVTQKVKPQRVASASRANFSAGRRGYPCH